MGDVLESNGGNGYTPQRYAAALQGMEYSLVKSEGVVELGELYPLSHRNGTNGRAQVDVPAVPVRSIEGCVSGEVSAP